MITTPTVFVLGAGASKPYGFPLGHELVSQICSTEPGSDIPIGLQFRVHLRESDHASIDAFLEHRPEFMQQGKQAIAFYLIKHEVHNSLFRDNRDWYTYILNRMVDGVPFDDIKRNTVSFVTFNYDRSLEHYLFTAISRRYGRPDSAISDVLQHFPIIHVHGQLGYLPWQGTREDERREYQASPTPELVEVAANGIKVISEDVNDSPEFLRARGIVDSSARVYSLGFGYHPTNLRRLRIAFDRKGAFIEGTCLHFTEPQRQAIMKTYPGLQLSASGHTILDHLKHSHTFQLD